MPVLEHLVSVVLLKKIVNRKDRQSKMLINVEDMEGVIKC